MAGKHRANGEGEFSDEELDRLWKDMEDNAEEDPEDD